MSDSEQNNEENKKETNLSEEGYVSDDPIILEAFNDVKSAILAKRTDIVRQILSAAESLREEDEYDSDGEEKDKKEVSDRYDRGEYLDLLSLLLLHKDTDSGTLLHYATRIGSPDIVRAILSAGANCTVKNIEKLNAFAYCQTERMKNVYVSELMQAVSQSRLYRVEQLLSAGIDINSYDGASSNNSVLHWAVSFSDLPTVQLVVEKGGDVNSRNANGETPLHDAVKRGDQEIIVELLKHGAVSNALPIKGVNEGKSPYMLAKDNPHLQSLFQDFVQENHTENIEDDLESSIKSGLTNGHARLSERTSTTHQQQPLPSLLITSVQPDRSLKLLCPCPRIVKQFDGLYLVPPTDLTVLLTVQEDLLVQCKEVIDLLSMKFQDVGINLNLQFHSDAPPIGTYMQCIINKTGLRHRDEYKLQLSTNKIILLSSGLSSLYYGMVTFLQLLNIYGGKAVPLVQISDWPTHTKRGVLFDFQDNDAPNIEQMCELADLLSLLKVNQVQMNVEHIDCNSQRFFYGSKEFCDFQLFCKRRFIRVSPYVKVAPNSRYLRLINGQEEIDFDKLNQLISLFAFARTLHVVMNDAKTVYQDLVKFCSSKKIHLQLSCGSHLDIHLDQMLNLMNNFSFSFKCSNVDSLEDKLEYPTNLGLLYDVCVDDVASSQRLCPNLIETVTNVYQIATRLPKHGCNSFIVAFGKEKRHYNNLSLMLPGLLITSSFGWNAPEAIDEEFIKGVTNTIVYQDDYGVIASRVIDLGASLPGCNATMVDDIIQKCSTDNEPLTSEQIQEFCRQLKMLKADLEKMKLRLSLSQFVYDEMALLTEILFFVAKLCYGVLNNQTQPLEIKTLSQLHKSDYSNRLMFLIKQYDSFVHKYYSHPPNTLHTSLQLLQNILKSILPTNLPPSAPNIMGVFTV